MKNEHLLGIDLPKWPALIVLGEAAVTEDQAIEINFRTNDGWYQTNNREYIDHLAELFGLSISEYNSLNVTQEFNEKVGQLELDYLANRNIATSYIGGLHGWCSWDGEIFANSYNIGKWPSVTAVYEEWQKIAKVFPFLKLKSQLFSGENGEDDIKPVVQFNVEKGKVALAEPVAPLFDFYGIDWSICFWC